jgi:acetylornithine aminotransferase
MANASNVGDFLLQGFRERLGKTPGVTEVRGQGLMIGIELAKPCGDLVKLALDQGLLINVTADNVIRLLPPLVFTQADAQQLLDKLCALVVDFLAKGA